MKCVSLEPPLTEPNVQKHNQRLERTSVPKDRTKSRRKCQQTVAIGNCTIGKPR